VLQGAVDAVSGATHPRPPSLRRPECALSCPSAAVADYHHPQHPL